MNVDESHVFGKAHICRRRPVLVPASPTAPDEDRAVQDAETARSAQTTARTRCGRRLSARSV